MSEFVNFKKRGITLPAGCKDLIDLLQPSARRTLENAQQLTTTRDETVTGALHEIGKYVQMAFQSHGAIFILVITPPDGQLQINLLRMAGEEPRVRVTFPQEPGQESFLRGFLARKGLQLPEESGMPPNFIPNLPVQLIWNISPLPRDAEGVSALIADLLRECGRLENDAVLGFHLAEASDAA